ncbi:MAG: HU family DNA-binding protein [Desulfomonilaceae bacterium]|nr:HU family DNA-binding protein [Desulfomonilaceae bacterium]
MNRSELTGAVAKRKNLPRTRVDDLVRAVFDEIERSLRNKQPVTITGFGTFRVDRCAPCTRRNPRTGEPVNVPAGFKARFKASETLNAAIQ